MRDRLWEVRKIDLADAKHACTQEHLYEFVRRETVLALVELAEATYGKENAAERVGTAPLAEMVEANDAFERAAVRLDLALLAFDWDSFTPA